MSGRGCAYPRIADWRCSQWRRYTFERSENKMPSNRGRWETQAYLAPRVRCKRSEADVACQSTTYELWLRSYLATTHARCGNKICGHAWLPSKDTEGFQERQLSSVLRCWAQPRWKGRSEYREAEDTPEWCSCSQHRPDVGQVR
jgi:hypothetical protein